MKKKTGLITWSLIALGAVLLTVAGFFFGYVQEVVALWTKADAPAISIVTFDTFFRPVTEGFKLAMIPNSTSASLPFIATYLSVVGVVVIALLIIGIAKKHAKYLWHLIPLIAYGAVGFYLCLAVGTPFNGHNSVAFDLFKGKGILFDSLLGKVNFIQPIFAWIMVVFAVVSLVACIAYVIVLFTRVCAKTEKVEALATETETVKETKAPVAEPTMIAPAFAEEPKEETTAKRKVFLVVKRYNKVGNTIEAVEEKPETLTSDDVKELVRQEMAGFAKTQTVEAAPAPVCECKPVEKPTTAAVCTTNETRTCAPTPVKKEEKAPVTPIIIAIPDPVMDEEEKPVAKKPAAPKAPRITKEDIRAIVADVVKAELEKILTVPETTEPETVEEVEEPVVIEETTETVAVLDETNTPVEVKEEAPVVTAPVKASEPIERISFAERMRKADPEMKANYNHIKAVLLSYGLKNRTSNGGDAFRLHKVTYAKICVAGKSLKLYLALDPNDYKNSTLPIKDASSKAMYKDIPLVFKVKSGLSMRRCEQLIGEMMDKHHIEQVDRIHDIDYVALLEETSEDED